MRDEVEVGGGKEASKKWLTRRKEGKGTARPLKTAEMRATG